VCCLFSSYLYVGLAAHRVSLVNEDDKDYNKNDNKVIILKNLFDFIFCVDIIANMFLSYDDK